MVTLLFCMGLLPVFGALGLLTWLGLRLAGRRWSFRRLFRLFGFAYVGALPVVIWVVFPLLTSTMIAGASTRPQDLRIQSDPSTYGCRFSNVSFPSRDGLRLEGWWLPDGSSGPPIILSHGLFRNRQEVLERGCLLNKSGYPVLMIDLRNHGGSQARSISLGFHEKEDVGGAIRFLSDRGFPRSVLFGVSMGAVASLLAAEETPAKVAAVVADSPFLSLKDTVARHTELFLGLPAFPFSELFIWNFCRLASFSPEQLNVALSLHHLPGIPVLLIFGSEDQRMPRETAAELLDAIPYTSKQLLFFEEAGHGHSFDTAKEEYMRQVTDFLARIH